MNTLFLTPCVCGSRTRADTGLLSALKDCIPLGSPVVKTSSSKARGTVSILTHASSQKNIQEAIL